MASCYFVELLQRLQVAQVSVLLDGKKHLTFHSNVIYSSGKQNGCFAWDGLGLRPSTYSCLKVTGSGELHARFKLVEEQDREGSVVQYLQTVASKVPVDPLNLSDVHILKFKRVLPLPSDAWSELFTDLFCHVGHVHEGDSPPSLSTIQPREGDCLVGDDKLLLFASSLKEGSIVVDQPSKGSITVKCKRCLSLLGTVLQGETFEAGASILPHVRSFPLCLHRSKLLVEESEGVANLMATKLSYWITLEDYFARRIYSTSATTESFRFVLQSDLGNTLVWVLSTGNRIAWRVGCLSEDHHECTCLGCYGGPEMCPSCAEVSGISCGKPVLKLLYKASTWTSGDDSDVVKWDAEDWLNLRWILSHRTKVLPPSQRASNGFSVGFLCLL